MATLAAVLLIGAAAPAAAHGRLKSSVPSAGAHLDRTPSELRLTFTERAEMAFTTVRLVSARSGEVALGRVTAVDGAGLTVVAPIAGVLREGAYTMYWQTAGADGHPVRGSVEFVIAPGAVGTTVPTTDAGVDPSSGTRTVAPPHHDPVAQPQGAGFGVESPLYVGVRWLGFVALLLMIGAAAFRAFVLRRVARHSGSTAWADVERRTARLGLYAAAALGAALAARLVTQSYAMHGAASWWDASTMWQMVRETTWGKGWMLQLAGVALGVVGFRAARRASSEMGARRGWALAGAGAVASAFSPALSGHAAAVPGIRALSVLSDGVHVLAASSWLGTLAIMLVAGVGGSWRQPTESRGAMVRSMVNAFSPVALASAAVAAVTGTFAAWLHLGGPSTLWTSRYGVVLLVKLGVLGGVALTGFYNWRRVQPRLGTDAATSSLQRSARVEVAIAVLVLLVTAVLVATPPSMEGSM